MRIVFEEDNVVYEPRFMELKGNEIHFYDNASDVKNNRNAYIFEYYSEDDAKYEYRKIASTGIYTVKADDKLFLSYNYPYCYNK